MMRSIKISDLIIIAHVHVAGEPHLGGLGQGQISIPCSWAVGGPKISKMGA